MLKHAKKYFLSGLLSVLPLFATVYVLIFIYSLAVKMVQKIIPTRRIVEMFLTNHTQLATISELVSFSVSFISILIIMFIIMVLGFIVSKFLNISKMKSLELLILKIPLAKSLYSTFKQLSDLILKDNKSYKKTVLIEYPRKGIYSMALVTNEQNKIASEVLEEKELYNLFVPTSPNPTSGIFLIVPKKDTIELDIKIEEAFKMIISGGAIVPDSKLEKLTKQGDKIEKI